MDTLKNTPLISIITPIYNSEAYLEKCICSILQQSYNNIEVLLIDDGSTDCSADICRKYAKKDSRIKYYFQENQGVSAARNNGLCHIKGDLIAFIDSDDFVTSDFLQQLHAHIIGYDVSICGYFRVRNRVNTPKVLSQSFSLNRDELYSYVLCNNNIGGYLCNKLFRSDIVKKHKLVFNTSISIGEDMAWIASYLNYVSSGYYINSPLYYYRSNPLSALQNMYTTRSFDASKVSNLDASDLIYKLTLNQTPSIKKSISYRYVRTCMWLMFNMIKCRSEDKIIFNKIKMCISNNQNLKHYIISNQSKLLEKICSIAIFLSPTHFYNFSVFIIKLVPKKLINKYLN